MERRTYHHGDLRGALLDAAESLVRERGVDGWSLREASARVGVSPSAAYHHFASRDVLVRTLADRVLAGLGRRMANAAARADPAQRVVAAGRAYVRWAVEDPSVARLVFRGGSAEPAAAVTPHPHDVLSAELDRLAEAGVLSASARAGAEYVVWAALHGLATLLVDGLVHVDGPRALDREAERLVRTAITGLSHEPPRPVPRTGPRTRRYD
ncbi:TetR/AcrR family transcriptional regulator [Saccharothrix obliqua]|uniref:TetR/AcrR family transcriptional regulator n=1 Tax=Saccharothrix obliqua TaxID=2861747 RepID=UPI001C5F16DB|nr:TetR/AcrR family transcriptional regulator [Saccharothrix obliqua]MBW4720384.1 TetR/AcrR family transcriptional regulator [Saccharothrix obliqua]